MSSHVCQPPTLQLTSPGQPDWTCGTCGRVFRDCAQRDIRWWAEVVGTMTYRCIDCDLTFLTGGAAARHQRQEPHHFIVIDHKSTIPVDTGQGQHKED